MSDFVYSSTPSDLPILAESLGLIHLRDAPAIRRYSGEWGAVAVFENHYRGFQPFEDASYLAIVLGGPLLEFRENDFLDNPDSMDGTEAILRRFVTGEMKWDKDLSGPFACLFVEKEKKKITYVTDLLMFVPIYTYGKEGKAVVGSHPDAVARAAGQSGNIDPVSVADFILNHVVTHPHTCYREIWQAEAGTVHAFEIREGGAGETKRTAYWQPKEETLYRDIDEAAGALREGLRRDIERITRGAGKVAAYLSSGEDSRSVVSFLPEGVKCDGFTYLYDNPRDQKIVAQVAKALGINSRVGEQPFHYYLDILSEASAIVGSGHQYSHAHMLGFMEEWGLKNYRAVLGGYLSDSLQKGLFSRKRKGRGLLAFLPEIPRSGETQTRLQHSDFLTEEALKQVQERRKAHMARVQAIRPETAHEWFGIWPATMQLTFPNFLATRRLMRSYEPFMGRVPVQAGAGVPLTWKLNRRMFNRATQPVLERTRSIFHGDGYLPYHSFWVNMPFIFVHKLKVYAAKLYHGLTSWITGREAPWERRRAAKGDAKWQETFESLVDSYVPLRTVIRDVEARKKLSSRQTGNLLQVLEWVRRVVAK